MASNFYVYLHRKATNGEVFYVGKGNGDRSTSTNGRSRWWKYVVKKHGKLVDIYAKDLDEKTAFSIEIELIEKYGRIVNGTGNLVNILPGGEGASGVENNNADKNVYRFVRKDGAVENCTRYELCKKYGISSSLLSMVINGKNKSVHGWYLEKIKTSIEKDRNKYNFVHEDGRKEYCTRAELSERHGIPQRKLSPLFSKKIRNKSAHGWWLNSVGIREVNRDKKVYTFIRRSGETMKCTRREICSTIGVSSEILSGLIVGTKKHVKGWYLDSVKNDKNINYTVYTWINRDGRKEKCTRLEMRNKYNLEDSSLTKMMKGKISHHRGWNCLGAYNGVADV